MVDLVFEDPPEYLPYENRYAHDVRKNAGREEVIAELASYPDRWAIVSRHLSRNRATQVARSIRERHPAPYEFRTASNPSGEGVVYGRYVSIDANID